MDDIRSQADALNNTTLKKRRVRVLIDCKESQPFVTTLPSEYAALFVDSIDEKSPRKEESFPRHGSIIQIYYYVWNSSYCDAQQA